LLQMTEPLGLGGDAACDFPQIACDVGELDPKAADPVGELIDQAFAVRGDGCHGLQLDGLRKRHRGGHSLYAVRKPPQ
jgi:hypothetical protein